MTCNIGGGGGGGGERKRIDRGRDREGGRESAGRSGKHCSGPVLPALAMLCFPLPAGEGLAASVHVYRRFEDQHGYLM